MSRQVKMIIVIICIGLGLFWNQFTSVIDRVVDTPLISTRLYTMSSRFELSRLTYDIDSTLYHIESS